MKRIELFFELGFVIPGQQYGLGEDGVGGDRAVGFGARGRGPGG